MTNLFKLGVIALILSYSSLYGQQKASLKQREATKKEAELRAKPGYYNQEESLTQWKKWNEQSPEAIARAKKLVLESGMFKPDPEAKTYSSYEEFQKAQARKGWQLPKTYQETQKPRIIVTTIPKKL